MLVILNCIRHTPVYIVFMWHHSWVLLADLYIHFKHVGIYLWIVKAALISLTLHELAPFLD